MGPPVFYPLFGLIAAFGVMVLMVLGAYAALQARTRREAQRLEFHMRMLDRMGSAREFGEFLSTEAGQRFLNSLAAETSHPQERVLGYVRAGVVLLFVGPVFLIFGGGSPFFELGVLLFVLGIGLLVSSFVSYRLARRLGMVNGNGAQHGRRESNVPLA